MILLKKSVYLVLGTAIMMTFSASKSHGFPLPTHDFSRIAQSVIVTMNQAQTIYYNGMEIQQKIEEIRNGGFGGAARVLVTTIQNGDIDRYGNNLKSFQGSMTSFSQEFSSNKNKKDLEEKERAKNLTEEVVDEKAKRDAAEAEAKQQVEKFEQTEAQRKKKKSSIFTDSYNWLKNHRSTTDAIFRGSDAVKNKDFGGIVSSVGDASGDSTLSILGHGIDDTYDDIKGGDWSGAINSGLGTVKEGAEDAANQYDKIKKQK